MNEARVTRTVESELTTDQLWALVGDAGAWSDWMVDEADVDATPGSVGTVTDAGEDRAVRIEQAGDGRIEFTWWPVGDERRTSIVELVVLPARTGSTLHITERFTTRASRASRALVGASALQAAGIAWDVRTLLLVLATAPSLSVMA